MTCVRSGFCCKRAVCPWGEWDSNKHQCVYLEEDTRIDDVVLYRCGRYDFIIKQRGAEISPAFGAGCCSPLFNEDRDRILVKLRSSS